MVGYLVSKDSSPSAEAHTETEEFLLLRRDQKEGSPASLEAL